MIYCSTLATMLGSGTAPVANPDGPAARSCPAAGRTAARCRTCAVGAPTASSVTEDTRQGCARARCNHSTVGNWGGNCLAAGVRVPCGAACMPRAYRDSLRPFNNLHTHQHPRTGMPVCRGHTRARACVSNCTPGAGQAIKQRVIATVCHWLGTCHNASNHDKGHAKRCLLALCARQRR